MIADRIRDTLSSVYGLKIKTVKCVKSSVNSSLIISAGFLRLDFRPFEEDPEGSTQCDWCGCDVGRDSNVIGVYLLFIPLLYYFSNGRRLCQVETPRLLSVAVIVVIGERSRLTSRIDWMRPYHSKRP